MEQVTLKVGTVKTVKGSDQSSYYTVTFVGERLGYTRSYTDDNGTRGRDVAVYKVAEQDGGGYVVTELVWSMWEGEGDVYQLYY